MLVRCSSVCRAQAGRQALRLRCAGVCWDVCGKSQARERRTQAMVLVQCRVHAHIVRVIGPRRPEAAGSMQQALHGACADMVPGAVRWTSCRQVRQQRTLLRAAA